MAVGVVIMSFEEKYDEAIDNKTTTKRLRKIIHKLDWGKIQLENMAFLAGYTSFQESYTPTLG